MTDNGGMVFGIKSFLSVDSYKGWFGGLTWFYGEINNVETQNAAVLFPTWDLTWFWCFSTGSISWVTATPADVVKSRLQADAIQHRKYNGILHCIMQSYKTEGIQVC